MQPCEPLRIVTFHLNQVGDLLFSLPALQCLRAGFPGAHLTAVVRPALVGLLQSTGLADDVVVRPRGGLLSMVRLASLLRSRKFHIAVSFSQSEECVLLSWLTGAAVRTGFKGGRFAGVFTISVDKVGPPSTTNNLRLVGALGCPAVQATYVGLIRLTRQDETDSERLLVEAGVKTDRPLVVLGPGTSARQTIKEWPAQKYAAVAKHLAETKGAEIVILGAVPDPRLKRVFTSPAVDLSGQTTLMQAAAILKRARLFVGVDSGLMHLAAAMDTRCVAIFGPTDPSLTGPQGKGHTIVRLPVSCSPCLRKKCPTNHECMENLAPEIVIRAIDESWPSNQTNHTTPRIGQVASEQDID